MMTGVHICAFKARREMPVAEEPYKARIIRDGAWHEVLHTPKPPKVGRCECESSRGRCSKKGVGWAVYVWGGVAMCQKHLDEECP